MTDNEPTVASLYALLAPITSPKPVFSNWAKTYGCTPLAIFNPTTITQCRTILTLARHEGLSVRMAGAGHSPSDLACTRGFMVRLGGLNRLLDVFTGEDEKDEGAHVVIEGGMCLADLHRHLEQHGLAMSNLGSISEQSIAGAISTGTHGTGLHFGSISSQVLALDILLADGTLAHCSRDERHELFMASLCGIGATGMIVGVKLAVEKAFRLERKSENVSFEWIADNLESIAGMAEHVRLWWFHQANTVRFERANRSYKVPLALLSLRGGGLSFFQQPAQPFGSWFWDTLVGYHFLQLMLFVGRYIPSVTTWVARFACWLGSNPSTVIDDSYKIFNIDCLVRCLFSPSLSYLSDIDCFAIQFLQFTTEWALPLSLAPACLRDLQVMLAHENASGDARPHFPVEIRFTQEEDIWLSPSHDRTTCWIGIVQYK